MPRRQLVTGPSLPSLESRVFAELTDRVSGHPESVLYLAPQDHPQDPTRERWEEIGPSAALRVETFDGVVSECYEHDQYKGRVTHIDRPLLFRLVELGVEGIASPENPLSTGGAFPSSGVVQEAEMLFTELEFAGLLSPTEMRERLIAEGVPDRAVHVEELAASVEDAREWILADEFPETFRTERMDYVTTHTALEDAFPSVDAVVISNRTHFDALELEFLEQIAETWPTIALLPLQRDSGTATGIDAGAERALTDYFGLGFDPVFHESTETAQADRRRRITQGLYRHPDRSPTVDDIEAAELDVAVHEPETISDEIRTVAQDIRRRLDGEIEPTDVGVVLSSPVQYADQVRELFELYELPFSLEVETPLPETTLGDVIQTVCQLTRDPRTVDTLLHLLTNPLVRVTHGADPVDHQELAHVAGRVETNQLEATLEHVDDTLAGTIESLLRDMSALGEVSLDALPGQLEALLDRLGVNPALDGERGLSEPLRRREQRAQNRLERVLETLALTEPVANHDIGNSVDRLERALYGVSVPESQQPTEDRIVVGGFAEAMARSFERLYVLGLTAMHFPSTPEQSAFARPIYDAHRDFEQRDVSAEARYHFGALFGSDAALHLSIPQRSVSGEPYVEADVITELRRVIDVSDLTVEDVDTPPGCVEDVQREIGDAITGTSVDRGYELVADAAAAGTVDADQRVRLEAGIECAAARASPALTPYDGQLSADTVSQIHSATERQPYSASRLETYAACGFKYYMQRVLGIEAPDPITREPDAGTRGSYIHDVLEHYYKSLQSTEGEPVHPGGEFEARQQQLLDVALDRLSDAFADHGDTAFHDEWLTKVLAGLGTPASNPYYGAETAPDDEEPAARGLFYRVLEHETSELGKTTARPTWFEARVGNPYDTGTLIQDDPAEIPTPNGPVPVYGIIDRIETVPGTDPTQAVVRDYKTGNNMPSESDALLGLKFQLPLYGLLAEDALTDVEMVGGAYYQVSPPASVNSRKGLLTSDEMATWHGYDDVDVPLLRQSYPHFDTHAAFRRFITETTPERLGTVATAIEQGQFQPTVLDPDDAGCRYCDYAHVCDVRPHQRREVIDGIDGNDAPAYVPAKARGMTAEDLGVE